MDVEYLGPLDARTNYEDEVATAAVKYGVEPELAVAVHRQEYDPNKWVSDAGARGPMQLMPDTAKDMGVKNIDDPMENIYGGVKYLKKMLDDRNGNVPLALASYNAGPGNVKTGVPPSTYVYVRDVMNRADRLRANPKIEYLGPDEGAAGGDQSKLTPVNSNSGGQDDQGTKPSAQGSAVPQPQDTTATENSMRLPQAQAIPTAPSMTDRSYEVMGMESPGVKSPDEYARRAIEESQPQAKPWRLAQPNDVDLLGGRTAAIQAAPEAPVRRPMGAATGYGLGGSTAEISSGTAEDFQLGGPGAAFVQGQPTMLDKYIKLPASNAALQGAATFARSTGSFLDRLADIVGGLQHSADSNDIDNRLRNATADLVPDAEITPDGSGAPSPEKSQMDDMLGNAIMKYGIDPVYNYLRKSADDERKTAAVWESKILGIDPVTKFIAGMAGGFVPGTVQFVTDKYLAPIHGAMTNGMEGMLQEGGERAIMGVLFSATHGYSRPIAMGATGAAFAGQELAHGGSASDIGKSFLEGAGFGAMSPGGDMSAGDIADAYKKPADVDLLQKNQQQPDAGISRQELMDKLGMNPEQQSQQPGVQQPSQQAIPAPESTSQVEGTTDQSVGQQPGNEGETLAPGEAKGGRIQ